MIAWMTSAYNSSSNCNITSSTTASAAARFQQQQQDDTVCSSVEQERLAPLVFARERFSKVNVAKLTTTRIGGAQDNL
jgi:hypothetical protein